MQGSFLSSVAKILWRLLEAHKIDADELFRQSGLDPEFLQEPRIRYPFESVIKAWVEASRVTENSSIGLEAPRFYTPLDMHALGVAFLSSGTLLEALHRLDRYESVLNSSLDFTIVEQENCIDLFSDARIDSKEGARVAEDARQSVVLDLCRLGLDQMLNPIAVGFTYPEPKNTGEHFATFRCPLEFSQSTARISFSLDDGKRRFTASNRELAISNDQILDGMMKELESSGLVSRVKRAILSELPSGTPSESGIASQVLVSSRTLQRKLAEQGTSFRELLLEVRRELAEQYISDKHMPLAEISYMLGFADQSSFFRAFKKWTGKSPAKFRSHLG